MFSSFFTPSKECLAYSCFTQLMKRMSQNFPTGRAMDTHFANMRSLIQVTWHMTFLPLPAWVSAVICLFFWCHLWHHEFWTLRVFSFFRSLTQSCLSSCIRMEITPISTSATAGSSWTSKEVRSLSDTEMEPVCYRTLWECCISDCTFIAYLPVYLVCLCQSYSMRMCLRYGRSSGSPLTSPPSTLSCSLHWPWWRCTGTLSWTTTWTSLISSSSLMVSRLNRGHL